MMRLRRLGRVFEINALSLGPAAENNQPEPLKIGQRFYDPSLGRRTQQGRVVHLAILGTGTGTSTSRAAPINTIDPTGTQSEGSCGGMAGIAGATAAIIGLAALSPEDEIVAVTAGIVGLVTGGTDIALHLHVPLPGC